MKRIWFAAPIGLMAFALLVGLAALPSRAADHLDAPGLTSPGGDTRLDINDLYVFQSPTNSDDLVFIMTVNPLAGVLNDGTFHPDAKYEFQIDNNGDAKTDLRMKIGFDEPDDSGNQKVKFGLKGLKGKGMTGTTVDLGRVGRMQAGVFDDPFFFDLNAFLGNYAFCSAPGGPAGESGNDFFAGLNVSGIVVELPRRAIGMGNIGVWARTVLDGEQIDRMGRPAINTVFIPSGSKNAFNAGNPKNDVKDFGQFLGPFAGVLLPDILTVDTSSTAGFLNGRQLADDVIDIELQLITGDTAAGDCVDANDVPFSTSFPYLAPAH